MAARRSSIKGDFKLRGLLRRIAKLDQSDLPKAMQEAANVVLATQQQIIPKDTGDSAAALQVKVSKNGLDARIGIVGKADNTKFFYLRFVEYGTKGVSGKKRNEVGNRRKTNKSNGSAFFGYYPDIPAIPAHPWLRPSYYTNRSEIMRIIRGAIDSTLRRAAEGTRNG